MQHSKHDLPIVSLRISAADAAVGSGLVKTNRAAKVFDNFVAALRSEYRAHPEHDKLDLLRDSKSRDQVIRNADRIYCR